MGFLSFLIKDKYLKVVNLFYLIVFASFFVYILYCIFKLNLLQDKQYLTVVGGWAKAIGIELKFDLSNALITLFLSLIMVIFLSTVYNNDLNYIFRGFSCIMLCGANGIVITNDIFNSYVFFEILCITTYIIYSYGGNNVICLKNIYDYVILSSFSGAMFLLLIAFLYQITGNLNIDLVHDFLFKFYKNKSVNAIYVIFVLVMMFKVGMYPFHGILLEIYKNISLKYLVFIASVSSIAYPYFIIKFVVFLFGNEIITNNEYVNFLLKIFGCIGFVFFNFSALITRDALKFILFLSFAQISLYAFCIPYLLEKQVFDGVKFLIVSSASVKACIIAIIYKIKKQLTFDVINKSDIACINSSFYKNLIIILLFIMSGIPISFVFISKWYILSGIFSVSDNILFLSVILIGFAVDIFACFSFLKELIVKNSDDDSFIKIKTDYLFSLVVLFTVIMLIIITFFVGYFI